MKVMMVGHESSGKTTFMAAMYSLINKGIENYSIVCQDEVKHLNLIKLSSSILSGKYPTGTDIHSEYNFFLRYGSESVINFDWYDYRGGALNDKSEKSSEVQELHDKIASADALIVFIDGEKMKINDNPYASEIRRLGFFVQSAINKATQSSPYPISLIITKGGGIHGDNLLDIPGFSSVNNIINLANGNNSVQLLVAVTEVNRYNVNNVQYPFLFSMYFGIQRQKANVTEKYNRQKQKVSEFNKKSNLFDDVFCFFSGDSTYKDMAIKQLNKMKDSEVKINFLASHLHKIQRIIIDANHKNIYSMKAVF
jgi:hypothetical protein